MGVVHVRERMGSGGPRGLQILRSGVSVRGGFDSHAFPPFLAGAVLLLCLLPSLAGLASGAAPAATDSAIVTPAPPDTGRAARARADSIATEAALGGDGSGFVTVPAGERRTLPKPGRFDQPHWVMLRSLAFPGWGQMHNDAWIKAGLIGGTDAYFRVRVIKDNHDLNNLSASADQAGAELSSADQAVAAAQQELEDAQNDVPPDSARIAAAEQALLEANLARAGAAESYNAAVLAYNTLFDKANSRRWMLGAVLLYSLIDAYVDAHFKNFDMNLHYDPALPGGGGLKLDVRWKF
jgi:uncharacterized protein DUF5683